MIVWRVSCVREIKDKKEGKAQFVNLVWLETKEDRDRGISLSIRTSFGKSRLVSFLRVPQMGLQPRDSVTLVERH